MARMMSGQVVCPLDDIGNVADVVGLGITEHLPWDAIAPKSLLASLPLVGSGRRYARPGEGAPAGSSDNCQMDASPTRPANGKPAKIRASCQMKTGDQYSSQLSLMAALPEKALATCPASLVTGDWTG
ncbi:hypothetical protein GFM09_28935 [Rhizobium leguminosarum bv. viciae]|nr:hypothetical protein [Rhizobium leguminosarum bv. viciae]